MGYFSSNLDEPTKWNTHHWQSIYAQNAWITVLIWCISVESPSDIIIRQRERLLLRSFGSAHNRIHLYHNIHPCSFGTKQRRIVKTLQSEGSSLLHLRMDVYTFWCPTWCQFWSQMGTTETARLLQLDAYCVVHTGHCQAGKAQRSPIQGLDIHCICSSSQKDDQFWFYGTDSSCPFHALWGVPVFSFNGGRLILAKHDRVSVFLCILVDGGVLVTAKFMAKMFFLDQP